MNKCNKYYNCYCKSCSKSNNNNLYEINETNNKFQFKYTQCPVICKKNNKRCKNKGLYKVYLHPHKLGIKTICLNDKTLPECSKSLFNLGVWKLCSCHHNQYLNNYKNYNILLKKTLLEYTVDPKTLITLDDLGTYLYNLPSSIYKNDKKRVENSAGQYLLNSYDK